MRINLLLTCQKCLVKHQNYRTSKAKKPQASKLNLRKHCCFCRKTQLHKEEMIK